jgi:hypothetical protein
MKNLIIIAERYLSFILILFVFWACFWLLNAGDKFLNGEYRATSHISMSKGALVDIQGKVFGHLQAMETVGFYGVNRNEKMVSFFHRIHFPAWLALVTIYAVGVIEFILGLGYLLVFIWYCMPIKQQKRFPTFWDRTIHRLLFKIALVVFTFFTLGDILFGERTELWEHGTFILFTLYTYDFWCRSDSLLQKQQNFDDD